MTDDSTDKSSDEVVIERDVQRTQDKIGDTVEKLEEKLSPQAVARDLVGDENIDTAKEVIEVARRNPVPAALIAVGAVWLFATSDAPVIRNVRERLAGRFGLGSGRSGPRPRSQEPAPIGPPPPKGEAFDRRGG